MLNLGKFILYKKHLDLVAYVLQQPSMVNRL